MGLPRVNRIFIERLIAIYLAFLAGWDSYAYFGLGQPLSIGRLTFVGVAITLYLISAFILVHLRHGEKGG